MYVKRSYTMKADQHFLVVLTELFAVLSISYGCTVVDVEFTIGFLNDNKDCVGGANNYPPVILQYRQQHRWIAEWNSSDTANTDHRAELSIAVSSSPPHFTLRWQQNAAFTTFPLFISNITLKGSGGPGNKCKLDKVINFASDGLDYVLCTSGNVISYSCNGRNAVGLAFYDTIRELQLCNFNLASGKCIGSDTCTISTESTAMPASTSFTGLPSTTMSTTLLPSITSDVIQSSVISLTAITNKSNIITGQSSTSTPTIMETMSPGSTTSAKVIPTGTTTLDGTSTSTVEAFSSSRVADITSIATSTSIVLPNVVTSKSLDLTASSSSLLTTSYNTSTSTDLSSSSTIKFPISSFNSAVESTVSMSSSKEPTVSFSKETMSPENIIFTKTTPINVPSSDKMSPSTIEIFSPTSIVSSSVVATKSLDLSASLSSVTTSYNAVTSVDLPSSSYITKIPASSSAATAESTQTSVLSSTIPIPSNKETTVLTINFTKETIPPGSTTFAKVIPTSTTTVLSSNGTFTSTVDVFSSSRVADNTLTSTLGTSASIVLPSAVTSESLDLTASSSSLLTTSYNPIPSTSTDLSSSFTLKFPISSFTSADESTASMSSSKEPTVSFSTLPENTISTKTTLINVPYSDEMSPSTVEIFSSGIARQGLTATAESAQTSVLSSTISMPNYKESTVLTVSFSKEAMSTGSTTSTRTLPTNILSPTRTFTSTVEILSPSEKFIKSTSLKATTLKTFITTKSYHHTLAVNESITSSQLSNVVEMSVHNTNTITITTFESQYTPSVLKPSNVFNISSTTKAIVNPSTSNVIVASNAVKSTFIMKSASFTTVLLDSTVISENNTLDLVTQSTSLIPSLLISHSTTMITTSSQSSTMTMTTVAVTPTPSSNINECDIIDVEFTVGYLNDNASCTGNSSHYPPVMFQYKQYSNNNELKTKWNTTILSNGVNGIIKASITLQFGTMPYLKFKLLQSVSPSTPAMFISNITLLRPINSCDMMKFDSNWLNYVLCSSGIVAPHTCNGSRKVGLVLNGLDREVRFCTFNLTNGKCISRDDPCTIDNEPAITPTKLITTTATVSIPSETSNNVLLSMSSTTTSGLTETTIITSTFVTMVTSTVLFSKEIGCTIFHTIPTSGIQQSSTTELFSIPYPSSSPTTNSSLDYCREEITNETTRNAQLVNTTRIIYCTDEREFVIQVCKSSTTGQPKWYPNLTSLCNDNGLPTSEDIYTMITTISYDDEMDEETEIEIITTYFEEPDIEILPGDPILITELLAHNVSKRLCTQEYVKNYITSIDTLMESRFVNVLKGLGKRTQNRFIANLFYSTDDFVLNCFDPRHPPPLTNHTGLSAIDIEGLYTAETLNLSTGSYGSFMPPESVISVAHNEGLKKFRIASYSFEKLNELLARPLYSNGVIKQFNYQMLSPINSKLISCNTSNCKEALKEGVKIVINHNKPTSSGICAFYNFSTAMEYDPYWSTDGCTVTRANHNLTVCNCNHLTHFAVLSDLSFLSIQVSTDKHQCSQPFIVYVCIAISLLVLLLAIMFLVLFRSLWCLATFVHINLCITLFIISLLLIFICANSILGGCMTVAFLLQYFILASFMWMLMEGIVLYIALIKVFTQMKWKYYIGFSLLCYGGPLLYMVLCIPLGLAKQGQSYVDDDFCFLAYGGHFIWIIVAPVIFILLIMALLLIYLFITRKKLEEKHKVDLNLLQTISYCYKRWLQGITILACVMTIVWMIILIYCYKRSVLLAYIFAIGIAVQSIIVFLLCTICFRKIYKIWEEILVLMLKNKQKKKMDNDRPGDLTIKNENNFNDCFEESQVISFSPTSHKDFVIENSSSFQPNSYTLREIFVISECTAENDHTIQSTSIEL